MPFFIFHKQKCNHNANAGNSNNAGIDNEWIDAVWCDVVGENISILQSVVNSNRNRRVGKRAVKAFIKIHSHTFSRTLIGVKVSPLISIRSVAVLMEALKAG